MQENEFFNDRMGGYWIKEMKTKQESKHEADASTFAADTQKRAVFLNTVAVPFHLPLSLPSLAISLLFL